MPGKEKKTSRTRVAPYEKEKENGPTEMENQESLTNVQDTKHETTKKRKPFGKAGNCLFITNKEVRQSNTFGVYLVPLNKLPKKVFDLIKNQNYNFDILHRKWTKKTESQKEEEIVMKKFYDEFLSDGNYEVYAGLKEKGENSFNYIVNIEL